jgi:membrane-bound ClpP family serine protease
MWSIVLLIVALALIVLELFIPSGGVLGFLAAIAAIASIVVAFVDGPRQGMIMLIVTGVLIPIVLVSAVRWWPHTPIGRLILIGRPEDPDDVLPDSEEYRGLRELIGKVGETKSKMLPSGAIVLDGRTYDAVSEGMPIDAGSRVKIVAVRTNRIVVQPTDSLPEPQASAEDKEGEDLLSRPVDSLGLDGLNDPLA